MLKLVKSTLTSCVFFVRKLSQIEFQRGQKLNSLKASNHAGPRGFEIKAPAKLDKRSFLARFEEPLDELRPVCNAAGTKTHTKADNENGDEDPGRSTRRAFDNGVR